MLQSNVMRTETQNLLFTRHKELIANLPIVSGDGPTSPLLPFNPLLPCLDWCYDKQVLPSICLASQTFSPGMPGRPIGPR